MSSKTVLVTGSNGTVGRGVVTELSRAGYRVVSVDRDGGSPPGADVHRRGDLLDQETVESVVGETSPEGIIHLGTLPHPVGRSGHKTYRSNVMTTYHLLEVADDHDVEDVCIASSINALGAVFQTSPMEVEYLPVDEDHPATPRDPYALGKRTIELQAAGFGRREGSPASVATLRFPWVGTRETMWELLVDADRTLAGLGEDPHAARDDLFAYVARDDAARALRRGLEADFEGHETFFATAADTTMETPTERLVSARYPDASSREFSGTESLVDSGKARELLGWEPRTSWRELDEADSPGAPTGHPAPRGELKE
ncbi:MAG: NAD-dependent epimerase/dehydratase family protein [Haloarculaceae archaeon]